MTDTALRTVLLTRPAHRNQRLAQGLQREGITTISLPALQVVPLIEQVPEDYAPGHFDLVVFVSGVAAECYLRPLFQQEGCSWPSSTKIGTVGVSTRAAAQKLIHQFQDNAAELQWQHPPALQPNHDSEQLWAILQPKLDSIKKVLIVRGLSGRDWLKDQFLQANIDVTPFAVYNRQPNRWPAQKLTLLRDAPNSQFVILVSSSESAEAIYTNMAQQHLLDLWQRSIFVVIHERIEKRVQSLYRRAGFKNTAVVKRCIPTHESMLSALKQAAASVSDI